MSDMPRGLQKVAIYRWLLLGAALLLTVVAGLLGYVELVSQTSTAPRSWVQHTATVCWVGFFILATAIPVARWIVKRVERAVDRSTTHFDEVNAEKQRLSALTDLMDDKVRVINDRKR